MKWQKIKDALFVLVIWLIAISILYIVYLKVNYFFNQ